MNAILTFALRHRLLMAAFFVLVVLAGGASFFALNIEAYPDPVPPLVDIVTQSAGQSSEEIERYITIPIEVQVAGLPYVTAVRSISLFGLSDVKIQFTYDFTYEEAEQRVLNRLTQLPPLPNGVQPTISPESPVGEIYRYRVVGPPGFSVTDLKTIEDWILERRLKAVPGVIDVTGWGGKTKTYDITVDLDRLVAYGLTLPQALQALGNSNVNVGGNTMEIGPQSATVRGVGLVQSMDDIRNTVLTASNGVPVLLGDVATVSVGNQPRLGIAGQDDDDDIVQGIILMRRGAQSLPTLRNVEAEIAKINDSGILPPGVRVEKVYDRTELIAVTTRTVLHNMILGVLLVFLVQWVFLGNFRTALVTAATIPFALAFAVGLLVATGQSANLLSVGAIDFGLVVDATVIMVENIFRHLVQAAAPHDAPDEGSSDKPDIILVAGIEVSRSIFYSASIIIAGFLPLFTLSGIEGHIFAPMARTYAYALLGGLIATFTITPALSALILPESMVQTDTAVVRFLRRLYRPVVVFALANRILTLGGAALLVLLAGVAVHRMGLEFLPKLEEGNLWIRATLPPSISLAEGNGYVNRMRKVIMKFPEVVTVVSQHGRPDDGTDATGFFNAEFYVPLKPPEAWPRGIDKEKLTDAVMTSLQQAFPGVDFNASQNIEDNVEEAASGVKGENSVKLFGNDLTVLERQAAKIKNVLETVHGIADLAVLNSLGQPSVRIDIDRAAAARYGLMPGDINTTIAAAIGGQAAGDLYEEGSDRHFPMVVRLAPRYRASIEAIRNITVGVQGPNGVMQVPLAEVAQVSLVSGASFIYRENQERYIPIKFSVRDRDLGGAVLEAQQKIAQQVRLPGGYRLEWVGEFGNLEEALQRLAIVVPLSIALICVLLYVNFGFVSDMLLAASVIPMAMIGGVFALALTGTPFSVSAAIGFVALFGIAAMDGIIVLSFFNRLVAGRVHRVEAILHTCEVQMRPVLMTCFAACAGLLPAALSHGIGAQVQRPLALVVVGGILLAPVLILIVLPVAIDVFSRRGHRVLLGTRRTQPAE